MLSKSSIEAKFKRAKLKSSETVLWKEMNETESDKFLSKKAVKNGEEYIICYTKSPTYSWIMSNYELIVFDNEGVLYYPYKTIEKVILPEIITANKHKSEIDSISFLSNGQIKCLFVEETTWHFVYDILRYLQ
jgi:hypothetical protein